MGAGMPPKTATRDKAKAEEPEPEEQADLGTKLRSGGATGNESPALPATVQSGAARAHGLTDLLQEALADGDTRQAAAIAARIKDELARYVPAQLVAPGQAEAARVVATEL